MAQNPRCDVVTFLIGPTLWPKTRFVTLSHSLWGQLYGPKRDQKLFKNSQNRNRDVVTFLIAVTQLGQFSGPNRDSVTLSHSLLGRLYGPQYTMQNA